MVDQVKDILPRIQYTSSASQTVFPYPFPIFDKDDLVVVVNSVTQSEGTDYTVSGVEAEDGGDVTFTSGLNDGDIVTIYRDQAFNRLTDYQENGDFLASTVNNDFDRIILMIQQLNEVDDRSIKFGVEDGGNTTEIDTTQTNTALGIDENGNLKYIPQEDVPGVKEAANISYTQNSVHSPYVVTAKNIFDRQIHVMDFIDPDEWANIENKDTASQDSAVVTAGVFNALRELKARGGQLNCGYGRFLITSLELSGFSNSMIYGGEFKKDGITGNLFSVTTSSDEVYFDRVKLIGTSNDGLGNSTVRLIDIDTSGHIYVERCVFQDFDLFGIVADSLTGGTYSEGVHIERNIFKDCPDTNRDTQCAVALGLDGEYSKVIGNQFFRLPSAVRCTDGANSMIKDNIMMNLNGTANNNSRAVIYCEPNSNNGKYQIIGNKLNHNESGQHIILLKGSSSQNPSIIAENEILVSGGATGGNNKLIQVVDSANTKVINNNLRSQASYAGEGLIELNNSPDCIVDGNYLRGGDIGINAKNSSTGVKVGVLNNYDSITTSKVTTDGTSDVLVTGMREISLRVSTGGVIGTPNDLPSATATWPATGHLEITHNIGSNNYSVHVTRDNTATPDVSDISVVRGSNTVDIYLLDNAGAAISTNVLVTIKLANNNEFIV